MSAAGDKIKEKLKQQGKEIKDKTPIKKSKLTKKDIEDLTLQMLKDFGYVIEG
jgi:hypothetical protein